MILMFLGRNWLRYSGNVSFNGHFYNRLRRASRGTHKSEERGELYKKSASETLTQASWQTILTVFFLARSPEAPRTTMTVLSLSSTELQGVWLAL